MCIIYNIICISHAGGSGKKAHMFSVKLKGTQLVHNMYECIASMYVCIYSIVF